MDAQDPVLARLLDRVNGAREHHAPLEIRGGGTKRFLGGSPTGEPLDMTELDGITSYEPTELVVTARSGTRLSDLEAALEEQGQCRSITLTKELGETIEVDGQPPEWTWPTR
jgi:glycolate oxidase FAD binding subunit